jgi:ankyrin repeat protein
MHALLQDVRRGDLVSVQARIGADRSFLNARRAVWPYTALECAGVFGHLPIARYLLGEGAQVNEGDGTGSPALRVACKHGGRQAMVELLLEAGADAVTPNEYSNTPLMSAAIRGHVGTIRALLAHGCGDINARNRNGRTALWCACYAGHANAALVLLEAGADMSIADRRGMTPLDSALAGRRRVCVAELEVSDIHIHWMA